ncbi:MAG: GNAT family N-acetyltransferase, partial [Bullifex sp.]
VPVRAQDIRVLDASYAPVMDEHYHLFSDIDYIKDRLECGVVRGIFRDGVLAGFMAEHSEGAMGMLEIFPEFQRQGFAYDLEGAYINEQRRKHRMYCNVVDGNEASERLQRKLGLVKASICSDWYSLY